MDRLYWPVCSMDIMTCIEVKNIRRKHRINFQGKRSKDLTRSSVTVLLVLRDGPQHHFLFQGYLFSAHFLERLMLLLWIILIWYLFIILIYSMIVSHCRSIIIDWMVYSVVQCRPLVLSICLLLGLYARWLAKKHAAHTFCTPKNLWLLLFLGVFLE